MPSLQKRRSKLQKNDIFFIVIFSHKTKKFGSTGYNVRKVGQRARKCEQYVLKELKKPHKSEENCQQATGWTAQKLKPEKSASNKLIRLNN